MDIRESTRSYERWLGRHVSLLPADLRRKHTRMTESPFGAAARDVLSLDGVGARGAAEVENPRRVCDHADPMSQEKRTPLQGQDLIMLAQSLARDAERHAILSASLASQADRLLMAGLRLLEPRPVQTNPTQAGQ